MNSFGIGSLNDYSLADQVGEGTYGYVFKAVDRRSGESVALKRLILHKESYGFPLFAVREIKFLKSLNHKNVVKLKDVVTSKGCEHRDPNIKNAFSRGGDAAKSQQAVEKAEEDGFDILKLCGNLYFVFEFVDHDLGGLIDSKYKFNQREIKSIMKQLLEVLDYLQERHIVHRDIKCSNILISNNHEVKLADFGLARSLQGADGREVKLDLSNNVITLWYRPPELLLGAVRYSAGIDIWSTGCVLAELELGRPIFPGKSEAEQLEIIFRTIGTPTEEIWPGVSTLPHYEAMVQNAIKYVSTMEYSYAGKISEAALQFLDRMFVPDPARRSTAKVLLGHRYFHTFPAAPNDPLELEPMAIDKGQSFHEYKTKLTRKQKEGESKALEDSDGPTSTLSTSLSSHALDMHASNSTFGTAATGPLPVAGMSAASLALPPPPPPPPPLFPTTLASSLSVPPPPPPAPPSLYASFPPTTVPIASTMGGISGHHHHHSHHGPTSMNSSNYSSASNKKNHNRNNSANSSGNSSSSSNSHPPIGSMPPPPLQSQPPYPLSQPPFPTPMPSNPATAAAWQHGGSEDGTAGQQSHLSNSHNPGQRQHRKRPYDGPAGKSNASYGKSDHQRRNYHY